MHERGNPTRVSITDDAHPSALSEGGRLAVEPVAGLLRNQWPLSPGIPGRLAAEYAVDLLREAVRRVRRSRPFTIDAWVVLPDHMHAVWTLPPGDDDFSTRWRLIKNLLRACPAENGMALPRPSRRRRTRHLATPLLGACHPRRRGLCNAYGLRSLQPGQARLGGLSGGVAVLHVQVVRSTRSLSPRLDGQRHSGCPGRRTRRMKHSSEYARGYSDEGSTRTLGTARL